MKKNLSILGSTGSIGQNTLAIVRKFPKNFRVVALAAKNNIDLLQQQIEEFHPEIVAVYDEAMAKELSQRLLLSVKSASVKVLANLEGLIEAAAEPSVDVVVVAISGNIALLPTVHAIQNGKTIALATKEILVSAGALLMEEIRKHNVTLLPIDSEHNAIFQLLKKEKQKPSRIILTASGGPFFRFSLEQLQNVTLEQALCHPTYKMGAKNTIDSATLMNKGLEVIEAYHLFQMPQDKIEVIVHPQSAIHGMVEFEDGALLAFLSEPNMQIPIQHVLFYPKRINRKEQPFDFSKFATLDFYPPPKDKFPCLELAYAALREKSSMACFLNAANACLVERFLKREISFLDIGKKLTKVLSCHRAFDLVDWEQVIQVEREAKQQTQAI